MKERKLIVNSKQPSSSPSKLLSNSLVSAGLEEPVSLQTADQFVSLLHSSLDQQNSPSGLASSVRDIIGKMDFSQILA